MTQQLDSTTTSAKSAPLYLTILLVVVAVAGGGALVWRWKHDHSEAAKTALARKAKKKQQAQARQTQGAVTLKNDAILVQFGPLEWTTPATGDGAPTFRHLSVGKLLTPRQEEMLAAAQRILDNAPGTAVLKVTDEQRQKLAALDLQGRLPISDEQQARLKTLAATWQQATEKPAKTAAEKALLAALQEIGTKSELAMKQSLIQSVEQIKQILTPQQQERIKVAGKPSAKPTTKTTTQPATRPVK